VAGGPRTRPGELLALELADGSERALALGEVLERPARFFGGVRDA